MPGMLLQSIHDLYPSYEYLQGMNSRTRILSLRMWEDVAEYWSAMPGEPFLLPSQLATPDKKIISQS